MTIARYTETTFFPVIVSWKYLNGYLPMITDMHVNSNTFRLFEKYFTRKMMNPVSHFNVIYPTILLSIL